MLRDEATFQEFEDMQQGYKNPLSNNWDRMVKEIEALRLTHPGPRWHRTN